MSKTVKNQAHFSCRCEHCQGACQNKPGWFKPGEAEKAAKSLGLSIKAFFDQYLNVDWANTDDGHQFVLSPSVVGETPGVEFSKWGMGTCVFFAEGKCRIYGAHPYACRMHHHDHTTEQSEAIQREVATAWDTPEGWKKITALLGHEPLANFYDPFAFRYRIEKRIIEGQEVGVPVLDVLPQVGWFGDDEKE
jgi:Fe-S-cluster containining protein